MIRVPSQIPAGGCQLAFVGEAPSDVEVERGEPFTGPSGYIFNALLRAANIAREAVYVGNVYGVQLEENDVSATIDKMGTTAFAEFDQAEHARLYAELSECRPSCVVAMGGTALQAFISANNVAQYRGGAVMSERPPHAPLRWKVLPTYHPNAVRKQWKLFSVVVGDFIKAAREAALGPKLVHPKRELLIQPTIDEVEGLLRTWTELAPVELLSVDIETGWNQVRGIAFAPDSVRAMYVPFIDLSRPNRCYWEDAATERRAWIACKRALESPVPKLGQNFGLYDAIWLLERMGIRVMNVREDTRLIHKSLYPELPASLGFMGGSYSQQGSWKIWARHGGTARERGDKHDD